MPHYSSAIRRRGRPSAALHLYESANYSPAFIRLQHQREKGKDIISSLILSLALSIYFPSDSGLNEAARFYHTDYFTG